MKKLILLCTAVAAFGVAFGQSKEAEAVKKKLEKVEANVADPKKGATSTPWIDQSNVLVEASKAYTSKIIQGFPVDQVFALIGQPKSQSDVTFKDVNYVEYKFDNINLYADKTGNIVFWIVTNPVVENGLTKAYESLVKAKSINAKDFAGSGKGVAAVDKLKTQLQTEGMASYSMGRADAAAKDFYQAFEAGKLTGAFDTVYLYYAGVANVEAGQNAKAQPLFEQLIAAGEDQKGMAIYYLSQCYLAENQPSKAIEVLEKGFTKYPDNNTLIASLINAYIVSKQDPSKIVGIVKKAQELDPSNTSLYLVESSVYNEIGDRANSYTALKKAMELDPKFFSAYFNYGVMKILEAEDLRKEADKIDLNDTKSYDEAMAKIIGMQKEAIEVLEKAYEIDKTNADVVDLLRQLYFPRRDQESSKYEFYENLSKEMQAK